MRLYRRSFPRGEQQTASTFVDSFWQNLRQSPFANYHFVVEYKRTPEGKPKLIGFSTMHVTRARRSSNKPRIALSEYLAIAPKFRRKGAMSALLNKRIEIARQQGAEWMIGEKEPWESEHKERLQTLSRRNRLSPNQKSELDELKMRQARMRIFSQWYKHISGINYADPSAGITFPSRDRMAYGKWDRKSANPLWLFARNLHSRTPSELPHKNVKGILNAIYRIHWMNPRDHNELMQRSLPETEKFRMVDPKIYLRRKNR
ncbi:MAG: GNAT family N-acetyltransferase [Candidatus Micrarchaeota archaeon]